MVTTRRRVLAGAAALLAGCTYGGEADHAAVVFDNRDDAPHEFAIEIANGAGETVYETDQTLAPTDGASIGRAFPVEDGRYAATFAVDGEQAAESEREPPFSQVAFRVTADGGAEIEWTTPG